MRTATRSGTTLIELLVVLVVLAIAAGIAGLAIGSTASAARENDWRGALTQARREAIASGMPVHLRVRVARASVGGGGATLLSVDSVDVRSLTALPGGSVLAPPVLGVERLTGRVAARSEAP